MTRITIIAKLILNNSQHGKMVKRTNISTV